MANNPYYQGPISDHFDGTRFFNPHQAATDRSPIELLRWRLLGTRARWEPETPVASAAEPEAPVDGLSVTMVGHASVLIQVAGKNLLVDPVWSERASPFSFLGPKRANRPGIAFEDLPSIDGVLVTHNHYDHLDAVTLTRLAAAHSPRFITPLGTDTVIARAARGCVTEVGDWGDSFTFGESVTVTLHPAHHWSARGIGDRRMALWCGFVIQTPVGVIYVAGDTAYGDGGIFRQVSRQFGHPVVALLPIGAYEPRWFMRHQHTNPDEAVRIMLDCGAQQGLGVHWGTFQLTDEPRFAPVTELEEACARHGVAGASFHAMRPGDVWRRGTDVT